MVVSLTGQDTITINGRVLQDLADTNVVELTFPNEIAQVKTGKNGNSIYAFNSTGQQCEVKIRIMRASSDDQFLNGLLQAQNQNFSGTVLLSGVFIKKTGDGQGNITSDTYQLSGGVFNKAVEGKSNVEGDVDQSVSVYMIKFTNAPRAIS